MMRIIDHGNEFQIDIAYNSFFKRNVAAVKAIPGARWNYKNKQWYVRGEFRDQVEMLTHTHRAEIVDHTHISPEIIGKIDPLPDLAIDLPIKAELRPYQKQGVARAMELKRTLIGDEQGLGKTLQAIATIVGLDIFPCLVIAPSSTKINWQRECEKFSNKKAMILTDRVKNTWFQYHKVGLVDIFITNYESLKKYFVDYMPSKKKMQHSKQIVMNDSINIFKSVIIDESHRCKNPGTLQSKLCMRIAWKKEVVLLLSGTPVINKPIDLYPQLCIMGKQRHFGATKKAFLDRYCEGGHGASNLRELNYLLNKHCFFRREKKDVAKDLPDKQRQTIICEITTRNEYHKAENDFIRYLKDNGCTDREIAKKMRGEIMVKMGQLKQISARGKLNEVKDFIDDIIDSGQKLVLFCNLHEIVDSVCNLYPQAVTITGRDSMEKRQRNIDAFQSCGKCGENHDHKHPVTKSGITFYEKSDYDHEYVPSKTQLIVCNIKAAGVGITLTASSRVAFIEYPWTYSDCVQAEDRCHRIGQTNNVMCTYFLGQNTIDERLFQIIQDKKDIANTITGASDQMEMTTINKVLDLFNI